MIIKGDDIPKNCSECPCCRHDSLDGIHMYQCNVKLIHFGEFDSWIFEKRPNWCPLRPLPEKHGRLIEADSLKETLDYYIREAGWDEKTNQVLGWVKDEFIDSEPTIVKAEGE